MLNEVEMAQILFASLVLPSFATLSFQQDLDHRGGSDDPGGSVLFQREEFLIAGHQELGLAGFSQREQEAVLGVRSDGAGGQVPAKKREVAKASGEQFGHAGAKSRPEERPPGNVAEFRDECVTGDEREPLALPSVEKLGRRAQGREKGGDQDVGVEDEAHSRPFGALPVVFCADVFDGLVNHLLELVGRNVGERFAGLADGLMKDAPADGFLDEFRNVALLHALGAKKRAQGMIGLFGPGNGQAGGFWFGGGFYCHINIYTFKIISYHMTYVKPRQHCGALRLPSVGREDIELQVGFPTSIAFVLLNASNPALP